MTNTAYPLNAAAVTQPPPLSPPVQLLHGKFVSLIPLASLHEREVTENFNIKSEEAVWEELFATSHGDASRESVWEYMPYGPFSNVAAMRECYDNMKKNDGVQFYVVQHTSSEKSQKRCAGIVSYLRIQPTAYSIEIGHIWHASDCQRGRANTEAVFLLLDNIFDLGYRRLEWKCNAQNERSRLAALRLGLAFEGVFRQCTVIKNKNRDTAWFALIDSDWAAVKQNMLAWLNSPLGSVSLTKQNLPLVEWSFAAYDSWTRG